MRPLAIIFILFFTRSLLAYAPVEVLPEGSRVGLSVHTAETTPINLNTDQLFPPASTLKIITALAAKLELGDDYRFATELQQDQDDLIISFSGDPTLNSEHLSQLLSQLKQQGMSQLKGDILLYKGGFSGYERGVGWPWDVLGVCYSAPASAITLDANCVQASIYTNPDGSTRVFVPAHQPIRVTSSAITVSKATQKQLQCDLELITSDNNTYHLSGCLVERRKPLPLKFAVQATDTYTAQTIRRLLKQHNIAFSGEIKPTTARQGEVLATHYSAPLQMLITTMLQESDNLIADNLVKTLGARFFIQPGSFNNGTEAIKQILYSKTGIDLARAQLADGSGLSRNNRLSVNDMIKVLDYILQHDAELNLMALLPKAGESGTLKYRQSMRNEPVRGHIQAKSGSLYGSYNMAGYVLNNNGQADAVFVQFITDYYPKKKDGDDTITIPAIFQFEQAFYQDLIRLTAPAKGPM